MDKRPFEILRSFMQDAKSVIILVGIDGPEPTRGVLINLEELVQGAVNKKIGSSFIEDTVTLTTKGNPSIEQKEVLGENTIHIQQYDISTPYDEIEQKDVNKLHTAVIDKLEELSFNVEGSKVKIT